MILNLASLFITVEKFRKILGFWQALLDRFSGKIRVTLSREFHFPAFFSPP